MARNDKLRIVQWYTGDIACHQIRVLERCPSMELVGAFVFHEDKVGLDAGEIAGIGPIGVRATNDLDAMLAVDADCVLYNPPYERYDEIVPILASGKNVVSIMSGWNPKKLDCYPDIVAACERGRSSLFGTGLNPGLSYELALLASSICTDVESVWIKTCEPQASLSEVFLQVFGFGKTEEELRSEHGGAFSIFKNLLSITDLLAEKLDLPHDGNDFAWEFEPATQDYEDKVVIRKGTMAGLLVKASTTNGGEPVATIELRFLIADECVRPAFLDGRPAVGWIEVDVRGTPGSRIFHDVYMDEDVIGTWSTGTKAISAVPLVCAAPPGLLSPLDLPMPRKVRLAEAR